MAIAFLFCIFLGRFCYVQLFWREELLPRAIDQWTREIPVNPERGKIFDRNGELLAGNETRYSVYARASAVGDVEQSASVLSALLSLPREEVKARLLDRSRSEITIVRQAEKSLAASIEGSGLSGIYYSRDNKRIYPHGALASQVLGFTAMGSEGTTGLERYYDGYLKGERGEILYETDLVGSELEGSAASYLPATNGYDLRLTLDYRIQTIAEEVMGRALESSQAKAARCIVLDPDDFSILAMANLPSYDPNDPPRDDMAALNALSRNCLLSDVYEPGSTFKVITAAADLEEWRKGNESAFSPDYIFPSSRTRAVDGTTIKCWSDHKNGKHAGLDLAGALNNSCNPCFVDMALALGKETFYSYLASFGFGNATGVDFFGEAAGLLVPESRVRNCDLARIGFGQSAAVTPLQLACAAASAVNGGYYYRPHLAEEIFADDGYVVQAPKKELLRRTVSEETSRLLASMLEGVVKDGSGKNAYIEGYRIAGKTGTAQKYENGLIAQGKYVSSFLGFFPAHAPRYLALVIVDEPKGSYYGSTVAAPCAKEIFQGIIDVMDIAPYEGASS